MTTQRHAGSPEPSIDLPVTRRRARRLVAPVAAATAGVVCLLGVPAVAQAASPSTTTFTFSGTVSGTLSQANTGCNEVGTYGGQFTFYTALKGSKAKEWTVNVNNLGKDNKKGGTFKKFTGLTGNGVSIVLEGVVGNTAYYWASKSGTLKLSATSGSLSVALVPDQSFSGKPGKGNIHITGSWGCQATTG
jgi:hypothetical protein